MKVNFIILTIVFSTFVSFSINAQNSSEKKASEAFDNGEWSKAINLFKIAYTKTDDDVRKSEIIFKTAECYRLLNEPKEAEQWFKKAIKIKYPDPLAVLYYADALKMNGSFDEATTQYQEYKRLVPDDPRGEIGVKSCELSSKWMEKPTRYVVENIATFNSKDADFAPVFAKKDFKTIYFSSNRSGSKGDEINAITGAGFLDLYETSVDKKGKWSTPVPLSGEFINTPDEEGASSVTQKGSFLYFTRCKVVKHSVQGCQIYVSTRKGTIWGEASEVAVKGGSDSINFGHPSISADENSLYFSSNLSGGFGGKDIWVIKKEKKGGQFGEPINLGPDINSPGNEVYPYIRDNGSLYFSSDYWVGMGGLDIFQADQEKKTGKWTVKNIQYPINSPADDFGIVIEGKADKGFFTSSRRGGKGSDDIYSFFLPPLKFTIAGVVKDESTDEIIPGSKVILKGSDGTVLEQITDAEGAYKFKLDLNTDYELTASKDKYLNGKGNESTKGLDENKDFKTDLYMASAIKPIVLPNINYDYGKWELRPESKLSLDKLVEVLNENPQITIELTSHTDFRGKPDQNMVLSQKRAQSVVNYLISKGIEAERLTPVGHGQTMPNIVTKKQAAQYSGFLHEGDILNEEFIKALATVQEQDVAHQINRRTDFRVLTSNYVSKNPVDQNQSITPTDSLNINTIQEAPR